MSERDPHVEVIHDCLLSEERGELGDRPDRMDVARYIAEALEMARLRAPLLLYDCPDGGPCKDCPCSQEDDVCFPGERLREELNLSVKLREALECELDAYELDVRRGALDEPERAELERLRREVRSYAQGNSKLHVRVTQLERQVAR